MWNIYGFVFVIMLDVWYSLLFCLCDDFEHVI